MHLRRLLFAAIITLGPHASAQDTDAPPKPKLDMVQTMIFEALKTGPAEDKGGMLRQMMSLAGRDDLASTNQQRPDCIALPGDPVATVVERARATNIVIINEDHAAPFDRHFIGRVLTALKAEGYAVYAAESLSPYGGLDHDGVLAGDGFYVNEPIYARTLGLAKSLGYRPVAYEQTQEQDAMLKASNPELSQINRREIAQTDNLMAAIFNEQPDAKAVIHVGHAHVWEHKMPESRGAEVWMAERLKARAGRDPLTIDQTMCNSTSDVSVAAIELTKTDGTVQPAKVTDLFIGHSPLDFRNGRVAWRQDLGERLMPIPPELIGSAEHVIVEARPEGAPSDVVPTDRILLRPGETLPLLLPPGRYRVEGFTAAGKIEGVTPVVETP